MSFFTGIYLYFFTGKIVFYLIVTNYDRSCFLRKTNKQTNNSPKPQIPAYSAKHLLAYTVLVAATLII